MSTQPSGPVGEPSPAAGFEPLSDRLLSLIRDESTEDLTLNQLLAHTAERGPYGLIVLLCLPFLTPISLPGVSNVFGVVILLLAWRIFHGQPARLPRHIGDRSVQGRFLAKIIRASIKVLRLVERFSKPRGAEWVRTSAARRVNAAVLGYGGLLLAAPIPPIIPCSNLVPAVGIILIAAAMMEEDALAMWAGYVATFVATVYLVAMSALQFTLLVKFWERFAEPITQFLRGLVA